MFIGHSSQVKRKSAEIENIRGTFFPEWLIIKFISTLLFFRHFPKVDC